MLQGALILLALLVAQAAPESRPAEPEPASPHLRTLNVLGGSAPAQGTAGVVSLHESETMVTRILRLAPGATIEEHHHPFYDETFFVHAGRVSLVLNDEEQLLSSGDVVYMPSGTIISGEAAGPEEAVLVVVWANVGEKGPLFVYGRPGSSEGPDRQ